MLRSTIVVEACADLISVWLATMTAFPVSVLLLKFNRGRLRRTRKTSLSIIFLTLAVIPVVVAGNILLDPSTIG
jgi:hypothetical protein